MNRIFLGKPTEHSQWSLNDWVSCGKWRTVEPTKGSKTVWTPTLPDTFRTYEQSKDILEILFLILSCKRMYWYQKDLPSTSTTSGMPIKYIESWEVGWSWENQVSNAEDNPCSSQQWTRWKTNIVWKKLHATWQSQRLFHSIIHGNLITIQYIVALAEEKRLLHATQDLFASRKWYAWKKDEPYQKNAWWTRKSVCQKSTKEDEKTSYDQPKIKEYLWNRKQHRGIKNYWWISSCKWTAWHTS